MNAKAILVLATLDTKGREADYLRARIVGYGDHAIVMDTGVVGTPATRADIPRESVAQAGGTPLTRLLEFPSRDVAAPVMAAGATRIALDLHAAGRIHGVIGLGGTQGTTLCTKVMRALPYGFPKVMVSTMASGDVARWVDIKDITMMFSVADILGLNPLTRTILANAAGAVCGAADAGVPLIRAARPLVAITTVGITTQGAMRAMDVFEAAGYEVIIFHAIGAGGRAMEQLMREGVIGAVLDYATIEVSNQMFHALLAADDDRLTTAGKLGLPQVLCPGAIEVLVFGEPDTVPERYKDRTFIRHSPQITDLRLNRLEMIQVAEELVRRLEHTRDEAVFMIPTEGYDSYSALGGGFHDPEADRAFAEVLKARLPRNIVVFERATNIEDPAFATEAANHLIRLMEAKPAQWEGTTVATRYSRQEFLLRLQGEIQRGRPLVMTGAGNGIAAKFLERGGVDIVGVYNTGYFRMQGYGSLAGMLPMADANQMIFDIGRREVLPQVKQVPVIAGVNGVDVLRDMRLFLEDCRRIGYSGVHNFPTVGWFEGEFRRTLEATGLGFQHEIDMLKLARELDLLSIGYAFNDDDTRRLMRDAQPDIFIFHAGITRGGTSGDAGSRDLVETAGRSREAFDTARRIKPDVILLAHGAALAEPEDARYMLENTGCHGVQLGSGIERLAIEGPLEERAAAFKNVSFPARDLESE